MKKIRIESYDLFRGILLVVMIVFHIIVNLTSIKFDQRLFYWVPAGFVVFLGVILARFLKNKTAKKNKLALKLSAIFLIFNIPNFLHKNFSAGDFIGGNQQIFSFEILFPMVIVIFLSNLFDKIKTKQSCLLFFLFLSTWLLVLNYFNIFYYNLSFAIYGLIGYFAASIYDFNELLGKINKSSSTKLSAILIFLAISIAPFFIIHFFNLYDILTLAQIFSMYFAFNIIIKNNKPLTLLGKHSLFLYIGHIIVIKLILL